MTSIFLDLPDDIVEGLTELRRLTGHSEQQHTELALRQYLVDFYDLHAAAEVAAKIDAGETHTVKLEDLIKEHGLASFR